MYNIYMYIYIYIHIYMCVCMYVMYLGGKQGLYNSSVE